MTEKTRRL